MPNFPRTDLAVEAEAIHRSAAAVTELPGVRAEETNRRGFSVTEVHVLDTAGENALCKPIGDYYTLALDPLLRREDDAFENAAQTLAELLRGVLPLTAYLLALAVWLVLGAVHFGSDAAARAQGRLAEETMAVTDWQLVGLVQGADGTLTTQDGDPQMILEDVGSRVVRTISYTAEFDGEAREMCLYYTTKVGEDYSADRRVFPQSDRAADVLAACREAGLLVLTAKTRLRLLPPLTLSEHDVDMALEILSDVLGKMEPTAPKEQA